MIFAETAVAGVWTIAPERVEDHRGFFARTWCEQEFAARGLADRWAQCSVSFNTRRGTLRGLHYQRAPHAEIKLVRCTAGALLDVVVDLRRSSPSYGRHLTIELDAQRGEQLFVPEGFAHGYCTLEQDTVVFYKVDKVYSAAHERGINWADPKLGIRWPIGEGLAVLSEK